MAKDAVAEKPKGAIVSDPELSAMNRINKTLMALDEPTRRRVLDWLTRKHAPATNGSTDS